jgi:hypothetical protein
MGLYDEVPRWLKYLVRTIGWALALTLIGGMGYCAVRARLANSISECLGGARQVAAGQALPHAWRMADCLDEKNGVLENFMMRPIHEALAAMPRNPGEFVGVWQSSQPRCSYRFLLLADGQFLATPQVCSLSSAAYRGYWGVHQDRMVWLSEADPLWPPDINALDYVDKDLFLLTERDGSRTKFVRVPDPTAAEKALLAAAMPPAPASPPAQPEATDAGAGASAPASDGTAGAPQRAPASRLTPWSAQRMAEVQPQLEAERYAELRLGRAPDWRPQIAPAQLPALLKIIADTGCRDGDFTLYSRPGRATSAVVADRCAIGEGATPPEYPLVVLVSDSAVKEIDLANHGFMYESGRILAYTDADNNGLVEFWLRGSVCECEGDAKAEGQQACDCEATIVVEDVGRP